MLHGLGLHEARLVSVGPRHGNTEERRRAPVRSCARHGAVCLLVVVLMQISLHLLKARSLMKARIPRGILGDARLHDPEDASVALVGRDSRVACARLAAPGPHWALVVEQKLKVLDGRLTVQARVPLGMQGDAMTLGPYGGLVAWPAEGRPEALLLALWEALLPVLILGFPLEPGLPLSLSPLLLLLPSHCHRMATERLYALVSWCTRSGATFLPVHCELPLLEGGLFRKTREPTRVKRYVLPVENHIVVAFLAMHRRVALLLVQSHRLLARRGARLPLRRSAPRYSGRRDRQEEKAGGG
mmetsp:Transcript_11585/g.24436  ORF Transcript_11585/g.24436 Transcript_11585/m.24436 type:complete len:300 (-) Transcript_11585:200-1099(-)